MAEEFRTKANTTVLPKPTIALEYISDNTVELFCTYASIVAGSKTTHTLESFSVNHKFDYGENITIAKWQNVVTYEVKDTAGKLIFICSDETESSSRDSFIRPIRWEDRFKLLAVSAIGARVEVFMK